MKRTWFISVIFLLAGGLVSCGSSSSSTNQPTTSGLKFRVFVSNPLVPFGAGVLPELQIIDASKDVLALQSVSVATDSPQPGLMVVSGDKKTTVVFSASNNSLAIVDNTLEALAGGSGGNALPAVILPDFTESMVISQDNTTAYVAVRNAPVPGRAPGAIEAVTLTGGRISDTVPISNVRYLVKSHNGNRILAFGDNQDAVTVVIPSNIGTNLDPTITVCQDGTVQADPSLCDLNAAKVFDRPVWGVFNSDDNTAYILSCGPECGGAAAGLTVLNMAAVTIDNLGNKATGASVPLASATTGLASGNTLYVAGTPPNTACGAGTAATFCGTLQAVSLGSLTASAPILITDGYHNRMELGSNGQVFIGARACTDINISGGEVRGCLSIFNTTTSKAVIPPETGDVAGVTGIQPITNRNVVYVVEGGELHIYDTTTDNLQDTQIDLIGQAVDVKQVDF